MIALHDIQQYVGAPPSPRNETYRRTVGQLVAWAWRDAAFGSRTGWWCAVTCGDFILSTPNWTMGGERERDELLERMLADHADVGAAVGL